MSTFLGSSAINKSGKKFAPKVARRRPAAATAGSEAASAASSAEQTPVSTPASIATPTNESLQSQNQNVPPTPPATQATSQAPSTQASVNIQPELSAPAPVPIGVPTATSHTDELDLGGRSPKRRRIERPEQAPAASTARSPRLPVSSVTLNGPVMIAGSEEQTLLVDTRETTTKVSQGTTPTARDDPTEAEASLRTGEPIHAHEPDIQDSVEGPTTGHVQIAKRVTQPKAVKRRGTLRVSNQDLIREVMGANAGVTKPSSSTAVIQSSGQEAAQSSDSAEITQDERIPNTISESPTMIIAETPTEFAPESHEEDIEPARLPRRAPNAAAARSKRQQAASSSIIDATPNDQIITQSGAKSAGGDAVNEDNGPAPAPLAKKSRQPRSRKRAAVESQIPGNELGADAQAAKPKRQRKRQPKTPAVVTEGNDGAETVRMGGEAPGNISSEQGVAAPKRPRSISTHLIFDEEDRENPEKTRIDATSMPMGVLTKDIPFVGTVSQREEALSKIDWDEEKRKRMEERERIAMGEEVAQTQAERDAALARLQEAANAASTAVQAPRMRVVNGNLVLDTTSTQVDRNARAREDAEELQEIEEDELTTRINQMSWIKANRKDPRERTTWGPTRADRWSNEQTEMFYDALKMFGTDFFIISKMFPGKTRANVKRKFVKEERLDPERIKRVLVGESVPMDFEEYKRKTGKDDNFFRDPEELRKELEQATEQQKQEVEEAQARYAEQQRQRKLAKQGGADFEGEEGEGGADKKGKAKKKADGKKGKKDKVPIGGEEIEVVELDGDELEHRR